jgi:DNA replication protein DnaC
MSDREFANVLDSLGSALEAQMTHRATCTARRCDQCQRYPCGTCGKPADHTGQCAPCVVAASKARTAAEVRESLPMAHRDATFASAWLLGLVPPQDLSRAHEAVSASRVVLAGPPGAGKTSLAAAMFQARGDRRAMFTSSFAIARARANAPLGREAELVARAFDTPLLVVDELGSEEHRPGSAVLEVIFERAYASMPTWITTGMTSAELATRYGGGTMRRLTEGATTIVLPRPKVRA